MTERIQRRRDKGWRMPAGVVYVGRPTRFGNPFTVGTLIDRVAMTYISGSRKGETDIRDIRVRDVQHAVDTYRQWLTGSSPTLIDTKPPPLDWVRQKLHGKDLCCWCPLIDEQGNPVPCHADVLLEIANP